MRISRKGGLHRIGNRVLVTRHGRDVHKLCCKVLDWHCQVEFGHVFSLAAAHCAPSCPATSGPAIATSRTRTHTSLPPDRQSPWQTLRAQARRPYLRHARSPTRLQPISRPRRCSQQRPTVANPRFLAPGRQGAIRDEALAEHTLARVPMESRRSATGCRAAEYTRAPSRHLRPCQEPSRARVPLLWCSDATRL